METIRETIALLAMMAVMLGAVAIISVSEMLPWIILAAGASTTMIIFALYHGKASVARANRQLPPPPPVVRIEPPQEQVVYLPKMHGYQLLESGTEFDDVR